ncbi:hypothetical protein [Chitinophaga sp.]|uniref:hypothetical protein n=1 Tax=Chitinophaga sp. TaxID=1869181 RepID=UPI0031E1CBFE
MIEISKYIYNKIIELSNTSLQRKLWLNENNDTGLISSYTELMCTLFDDYQFDDFVDKISFELKLSNTLIWELKKLRESLNNYDAKDTDEEIINDPKWGEIVGQAQKVIEKWGRM